MLPFKTGVGVCSHTTNGLVYTRTAYLIPRWNFNQNKYFIIKLFYLKVSCKLEAACKKSQEFTDTNVFPTVDLRQLGRWKISSVPT